MRILNAYLERNLARNGGILDEASALPHYTMLLLCSRHEVEGHGNNAAVLLCGEVMCVAGSILCSVNPSTRGVFSLFHLR